MTADRACHWVRRVAVVAALVGGFSGALVGMQKAVELSDGQSPPDTPISTASTSGVLDFGIVAYYAIVGTFVGMVLVSGPLTLVECRRFGKIREDVAMASRMKVQQALHDAASKAATPNP